MKRNVCLSVGGVQLKQAGFLFYGSRTLGSNCMISRAPCEMKMQGPSFQSNEEFQNATTEHKTKRIVSSKQAQDPVDTLKCLQSLGWGCEEDRQSRPRGAVPHIFLLLPPAWRAQPAMELNQIPGGAGQSKGKVSSRHGRPGEQLRWRTQEQNPFLCSRQKEEAPREEDAGPSPVPPASNVISQPGAPLYRPPPCYKLTVFTFLPQSVALSILLSLLNEAIISQGLTLCLTQHYAPVVPCGMD